MEFGNRNMGVDSEMLCQNPFQKVLATQLWETVSRSPAVRPFGSVRVHLSCKEPPLLRSRPSQGSPHLLNEQGKSWRAPGTLVKGKNTLKGNIPFLAPAGLGRDVLVPSASPAASPLLSHLALWNPSPHVLPDNAT